MRHGIFPLLLVLSCGLASCGGSSTPITPPPPAGTFSNASLNGQYAFSMTGLDSQTGAFAARVGSFLADGNGHITGGLEDVLNLGAAAPPSLVSISSSTYQIQANGRGFITLNAAGGASLQLSVALQSDSQGFLMQADGNASTTGTLSLQTPGNFSGNAILGKYVFDFSGVSFAGAKPSPISLIGQLSADGNGNLTSGVFDINDGAFAPTGPTAIVPDVYQVDSNGNGSNFGRGTLSFNGRSFAFYIVNGTHLKLIEEDELGGTAGDAILQTGAIPTQTSSLDGNFVFLTQGSVTNNNFGPDARAGRFTANGSGGLTTLTLDDNKDGDYTHISANSSISAATYAIDSANPGSGRGTFTFHNSSLGTLSYVFYLSSPTRAVLQDQSAHVVADGTMLAQSGGPFTSSSVAGNYSLLWTGNQRIVPAPFKENFVGQYALTTTASKNLTGTVDYVELGLNTVNNGVTLNTGISGNLTVTADGTQNNSLKVAFGGSSPFTINFQAYFADNGTLLVVSSDSKRSTSGFAILQAP